MKLKLKYFISILLMTLFMLLFTPMHVLAYDKGAGVVQVPVKSGGASSTSSMTGQALDSGNVAAFSFNHNGVRHEIGAEMTVKKGKPGKKVVQEEPPCYIYSYYGSGATFALMGKMEAEKEFKRHAFQNWSPDAFVNTDFQDFTEDKFSTYQELIESGSMTEEQVAKILNLTDIKIKKGFKTGENGVEDIVDVVTNVYGLDHALDDILTYNGSKDDDAKKEAFDNLKEKDMYIIEPNPAAIANGDFAKPGEDGSNARCGTHSPGEVQVLITDIPTAPPRLDGKSEAEYAAWLTRLANNVGFQVQLEETGDKTFTATITFNDRGTSIYGDAMLPKEILDVTFIWGLRAPDSSEPYTKTVKAGQAGIPTESMSTLNDALKFDFEFTGESMIVSSGSMESALSSAFSQFGGSLSGGQYVKTTDHLLAPDTIAILNTLVEEANFSNPLSALDIVQITPHRDIDRVFTRGEGSSFVPLYENFTDVFTDTYTIPSSVEGKYIVTVSAMVNGHYIIPENLDGDGFSFTYPLGFDSDTAFSLTSTCAQIANDIRSLGGELVEDVEEEMEILESMICQEKTYVGPNAVADYEIVSNQGEVDLIASDSTGTYEYTHTYRFEAETETVSCGEDCEEEIYTGDSTKIEIGPPEEQYYEIVNYTWAKEYRVFMPDGDGLRGKEYNYELDLSKGTVSGGSSVTRAMMHKGDTFACVSVKTNAPQSNFDGGGPRPQPIKDRSGKAYLTPIFDSYDKSLYFDQFSNRENCIFIDVENKDWRIHENTYDKQN